MQEVNADQVLAPEQPVEIEVSLSEFDELVEDKKALDRLVASADYKRIIGRMFLTDDKMRLVGLLGSQNIAAVRDEATIVAKIKAKAYLEQFLTDTATALIGIDNPEQRIEMLRQISELQESQNEAE